MTMGHLGAFREMVVLLGFINPVAPGKVLRLDLLRIERSEVWIAQVSMSFIELLEDYNTQSHFYHRSHSTGHWGAVIT